MCVYVSFNFLSLQQCFFLSPSIWAIDETLTDTTTLGLSEPGSNSNEGVLHYLQN